jgi:hypothetical protein
MRSLWRVRDRHDLQARISRLSPSAPAKWGRMSAPEMVSHLVESLRMATGELPVASRRLPLRYPPLKQFIVYLMPFPKGVPTAPELKARVPGDWPSDVRALSAAMDGCAGRPADGPWPHHPAFGKLSHRAWGVLAYRHIDHHLRQFGV